MALTELYVDSTATGAGDGSTPADAYTSIEAAIVAETFDTTNGVRINIKGAQTLVADLSVSLASTSPSVAWVPSATAPLLFQGYTATAGDGGIGELDGNGLVSIFDNNTQSFIAFVDMKIGNVGNNFILDLNDQVLLYNCEIYGTAGFGNGVSLDVDANVQKCYFHDIVGYGILTIGNQLIKNNYFESIGAAAITNSGADGWNIGNIISCSGTSSGINASSESYLIGNSIWSNGGSGAGIFASVSKEGVVILNNIIEGFSGSGGVGIDGSNMGSVRLRAGNSLFDNETNITVGASEWLDIDNEVTLVTSFNDPSNGDFSPASGRTPDAWGAFHSGA